VEIRYVEASELDASMTDLTELLEDAAAEPLPVPDGYTDDADAGFEFIDGLMRAFAKGGRIPEEGKVIEIRWPDEIPWPHGGSLLIWPGDPRRWVDHQDGVAER
jgi:hypothetical protein